LRISRGAAAADAADHDEFRRIVDRLGVPVEQGVCLVGGAHGQGQPVGDYLLDEIVHGGDALRAREVARDDVRLAVEMRGQEVGDQPAGGIGSAARRAADDHRDGLALE
jgi:hypothetical protein